MNSNLYLLPSSHRRDDERSAGAVATARWRPPPGQMRGFTFQRDSSCSTLSWRRCRMPSCGGGRNDSSVGKETPRRKHKRRTHGERQPAGTAAAVHINAPCQRRREPPTSTDGTRQLPRTSPARLGGGGAPFYCTPIAGEQLLLLTVQHGASLRIQAHCNR
ncbi:hypothetical protein EYF80_047584 [Liparis tanakae]|uniref:Uncharacterized protein n=1 Tax=Liparis tanakae TaxID=230148 RepID=A0A4Z2FN73_9TELE|nr:hypothetical protein EYF80_047584 [Liparis tanakae]